MLPFRSWRCRCIGYEIQQRFLQHEINISFESLVFCRWNVFNVPVPLLALRRHCWQPNPQIHMMQRTTIGRHADRRTEQDKVLVAEIKAGKETGRLVITLACRQMARERTDAGITSPGVGKKQSNLTSDECRGKQRRWKWRRKEGSEEGWHTRGHGGLGNDDMDWNTSLEVFTSTFFLLLLLLELF